MRTYRNLFDELDDTTVLEVTTRLQAEKQEKKRTKPGALILVAAMLSVLVVGVSAAGYFLSNSTVPEGIFNNRRDDGSQIVQYTPNNTPSGVSAEAAAQQEWNQFQTEYLTVGEFGTTLPDNDPLREIYGIRDETQRAKLQEIAEKYGLKLLNTCYITENTQDFLLHTGKELPAAPCNTDTEPWVAKLYNDGNYVLNGLRIAVDGRPVSLNFLCTAKGSFTDYLLLGDAVEAYETREYVLRSGTGVTLSLGAKYSMIFCQTEECYLTVSVAGGYDPGMHLPLLNMTQLQTIAETVIH